MRSGAKVTVHQRHNWTSLSQCSHTHTHTHTDYLNGHCVYTGTLILSSLQCWQTGRRLRNYLAWWRSWLRHLITTRKVAGSIPDGVTGIIHSHNLSCRNMTLGSTQNLTWISTSNTSWWVNAAGSCGWHSNHLHVPIVRNLGASTSCNLRGTSRPVTRMLTAFLFSNFECQVAFASPCTILVTLTLQQTVLFEKLILEHFAKQLLQFLPHEGLSVLTTVRHSTLYWIR